MEAENRKIRILSIDGGGIRGIIPATILSYLEARLQEIDNNPDGRLADYFDMFAGTSTGGILSCAFLTPGSDGRPGYTANDAVNLYMERGGDIFTRSLWQKMISLGGLIDEKHSSEGLEKAFIDYFGETRLSELLKPSLITAYDTERRSATFFTGHNAIRKKKDFLVRDVVRATTAAPTYFELAGIKDLAGLHYSLIDGGLFANNPAMCAYAEARKTDFSDRTNKPTAKDMLLLSVGTGLIKKEYRYDKAKDWGLVEWIRPVIDIMMSGVAETVDYQLKQIFDSIGKPGNYLKITPSLAGASHEMDNVDPDNLVALSRAGSLAAEANRNELDRFAELLLENK